MWTSLGGPSRNIPVGYLHRILGIEERLLATSLSRFAGNWQYGGGNSGLH